MNERKCQKVYKACPSCPGLVLCSTSFYSLPDVEGSDFIFTCCIPLLRVSVRHMPLYVSLIFTTSQTGQHRMDPVFRYYSCVSLSPGARSTHLAALFTWEDKQISDTPTISLSDTLSVNLYTIFIVLKVMLWLVEIFLISLFLFKI